MADSKTNTVTQIDEWFRSLHKPKAPKRILIVLSPQASEGLKEFSKQYNRLVSRKVTSMTAYGLKDAVMRAETAKNLVGKLSTQIQNSKSVQDSLSGLQLSVFAAANWVRRFADDRHNAAEWNVFEEKKMGRKMADNIKNQVDSLIAGISEKYKNKTVENAFKVFLIKWGQDDAAAEKQAEKDNEFNIAELKKLWKKVEKQEPSSVPDGKKQVLRAYCAELEDSKKELNPEQQELVNHVKAWLPKDAEESPAWITKGIKTIGPFGIAANIKIEVKIQYPDNAQEEKKPGKFIVTGPKAAIAPYEAGLNGEVSGMLSPVFKITIKKNDPVNALIRIPPTASFFAFAYPVISSDLEVQIVHKSHLDAFLLYGGFVYFDQDMKLIQCNCLWVGSQLQTSGPKQLPPNVTQALKDAGRFKDITLPYLLEAGARKFAWVTPGEFPEMTVPHGGWAYLYEDESVNNYFSVAAAESVMGLTKAVSLRDLDLD